VGWATLSPAALGVGDLVNATARPEVLAGLTRQFPERVTALPLDVCDADQCQRAVEPVLAADGRLDVLVNNAGHGIVGAVEETTEEELRDEFDVLFFGAMRLTRRVLPHMRAWRSGAVVQVSSMMWLMSLAGASAYCAAKGALEQASEALAGGDRLLTDGPFMETKEHLLGFFLLEVPDLDTALEWAARLPLVSSGTVEVRAALAGQPWQAVLD